MSSAKIIKPTVITDAMFVSSTVAEPDAGEVLWVGATPYAIGAQVIRKTTHRKYMRKVAGTSAAFPEVDAANWQDIGPTNQRAMLDRKVGTLTTSAASMTVVLRPGTVGGVGLLELVGRSAIVTMKDAPGGVVVYSRTVVLDGTVVTSIYEWFFSDYEQLTDVVLTDLPQHFSGCELIVQAIGTNGVSVGVLAVGRVIQIGDAQYGASVGIVDSSKKSRDDFGNYDVLEREYSKRGSFQIITKKSDFNRIYRLFASLRATPFIIIGVDEIGFEPMIQYCFYKDFSIVVPYPLNHLCNIETEGL